MIRSIKLIELWKRYDKLRFLIVGGWNFVFGYCQFAFFYWWLSDSWSDFAILVLTNIIGISQSFLTHRYLTFQSNGTWWKEYLKFYVVYGFQALVGMFFFFVFVTRLGFNAYITNLIINIILTVVSYWAHKHYSFKTLQIKFLLPVRLSARQASRYYARPYTARKRAGRKNKTDV